MPKLTKPMRKKELEALDAPTRNRICQVCGKTYQLGTRKINPTSCLECSKEKQYIKRAKDHHDKKFGLMGFEGSHLEKVSEFEAQAVLRANDLLAAYVDTMQAYGAQGNSTLMTLNPPEIGPMPDHLEVNEFTPFLKQLFINLYVKMPRQVSLILEHLGISNQRYRKDLDTYPAFYEAVKACDKKHTELLEIVSYHNALNPKATSERIFLLKAGDPARYRESFRGDTFNLGQMNIVVSSNIPSLGIEKNAVAGGGKLKGG